MEMEAGIDKVEVLIDASVATLGTLIADLRSAGVGFTKEIGVIGVPTASGDTDRLKIYPDPMRGVEEFITWAALTSVAARDVADTTSCCGLI